jgi:pyridinium-3,5-biscarboxylic acid mononucleotide sulfurtransferase
MSSTTMNGHIELENSQARLDAVLLGYGSIVVAFSGGTDSAFLVWAARRVLGRKGLLAVTAASPSLAEGELLHCASLAGAWDIAWESVATDEMDNDAYVANTGDRCYWCKTALMDVIEPVAQERQAVVVLGVNVDDLGDHRPGQKAAAERGARFPLVEAGLTKEMIRALSKSHGLVTWDRPAAACLSSRLPYGTPVTLKTLSQVDRAEAALHRLGFMQLRVRHYNDTARLEVPVELLDAVVAARAAVVQAVKAAGYAYVTLDLEGFRSGNLNAALGALDPLGAGGDLPIA